MVLLVGRRGHQSTRYEPRSKSDFKDSGIFTHLLEAGVKVLGTDNNHILLETNDWIYSTLITTRQW